MDRRAFSYRNEGLAGGLDETLAHFQKEIRGSSTGLLHKPRVAAVFDFRFLKYKLHGNLRLVSPLDERPAPLCHGGVLRFCTRLGRRRAGCGLALMLAKFRPGQTVVSSHGVVAAKQRGYGESPWTMRAGPAVHIALDPDQRALHAASSNAFLRRTPTLRQLILLIRPAQ